MTSYIARAAEEHLAVVIDTGRSQDEREFAVDVVGNALHTEPTERLFAMTFAALQKAVDRDDTLPMMLLWRLGPLEPGPSSHEPMLRLGRRAFEGGRRATLREIVQHLESQKVDIPEGWRELAGPAGKEERLGFDPEDDFERFVRIDDLVFSYFEADRWKDAVPELADYHRLRLSILIDLFGCSIETFRATSRDEEELVRIARECIRRANELEGPFGHCLEGPAGPRMLRLRQGRGGRGLEDAIERVGYAYHYVLKDVLIDLFPDSAKKTFERAELHRRGLPLVEPDPDDFI